MWSDKDNQLANVGRGGPLQRFLSSAFLWIFTWKVLHTLWSGYGDAPFLSLAKHIKSRDAMSGQTKMDCNNPPPRCVPLYCSQATQTLPESDYEAESSESDFPPIRIGKRMSPASAMRRNQHQLSLSDEEEPPQLRRRQQRNTGLGKTNILNVVDATAPVQRRKVTLYTSLQVTRLILNLNAREFILIRTSPCQNETMESKTLPMNTHWKNSIFLFMIKTTWDGCSRRWCLLRTGFRGLRPKYKRQMLCWEIFSIKSSGNERNKPVNPKSDNSHELVYTKSL